MSDLTSLPGALPALRANEFDKIRQLAAERFGLELKPGKEELVYSRLGKKLREGGFASFGDYYRHVVEDRTGESLVALIDALTTNFTSFFREADHFDFLRAKILPELRQRKEIRIWCAAAASGEEPYSIVFTLLEAFGMQARSKIKLLATDISTRALSVAERGVYPEERFAGVPQAVRQRYLLRGHGDAEGYYKVRPDVRACVEFRRLNLIEPMRHPEMFPVIFCRNVMIYFSPETRRHVVSQLLEWLEPGGHLIVGHAESLGAKEFPLEYVRPAVYRKRLDGRWRNNRRRD